MIPPDLAGFGAERRSLLLESESKLDSSPVKHGTSKSTIARTRCSAACEVSTTHKRSKSPLFHSECN